MNTIGRRTAWYFVSSFGSAAVAFGTLPLATTILGPHEYGNYMLFTTFAALVAGLANSGVGYVLPSHLPTADRDTARQLIGSTLLAVSGLALAGGALAVLAVATYLHLTHQSGATEMAMAVAAAVLATPWTVAIEVSMLRGQARSYSVVALLQSAVASAVLLLCLFWLRLGGLSLFVSGLLASLVPLSGAIVLLRGQTAWPRDRRWLKEIRSTFAAMAGSNVSEQAQTAIERSLLALTNSLSMVGLWGHAMQYRQYAMIGLNAVSRAVWPLNLDESRADPPTFPMTRRYWSVVQIGLVILGATFALVGRDVIRLLTNDRFTDAAPYAAFGVMSLLIQTAGKAQIALLVARGRGIALSHAQTWSSIVRVAVLVALLARFGLPGAVIALVAHQLTVRLLVWREARRIARTPFMDLWVVAGCVVIPLCVALAATQSWALPARGAFAASLALTFLYLGRDGVAAFFAAGGDLGTLPAPVSDLPANGASNG